MRFKWNKGSMAIWDK
ncbi:hypothetical protein OH492_27285 [Vibrio chagasii]|nr:hypothetical protein [Vibrio chagasii]